MYVNNILKFILNTVFYNELAKDIEKMIHL